MDIDILGISEMKCIGNGHFRSANNTMMYSEHKTHRKNDVGMIITNQVPKSLIGYKVVNDRIIYKRLKAHPVNMTCIQVYGPNTSAETADIEDFYGSLHSAFNETPKKDVLILIGEWNSKIDRGDEPGMVGRYGLGNRNEAGEQLLEFCEENDLFQANAYTWTSPDGQCRNQIDYIPGKRQWRSTFQSVKTRPEADCGSDHKLLGATVRIKLKNRQHAEKGWEMDTENIPEEYKSEIKQNGHNKHTRRKFRGNIDSLERHFQGGGKQNHPEKGKEKRNLLDVPRQTEGSGEQAANENERKLG